MRCVEGPAPSEPRRCAIDLTKTESEALYQLKQETKQMTEPKENSVDKTRIVEQIADLSRLLGMIPSDDTITVIEPVTNKSIEISKWFNDTRNSFLKLSLLLDKTLDLNLQ